MTLNLILYLRNTNVRLTDSAKVCKYTPQAEEGSYFDAPLKYGIWSIVWSGVAESQSKKIKPSKLAIPWLTGFKKGYLIHFTLTTEFTTYQVKQKIKATDEG